MFGGMAQKSVRSISHPGALTPKELHLYTFAKSGSSETGVQTERTYHAKRAYRTLIGGGKIYGHEP